MESANQDIYYDNSDIQIIHENTHNTNYMNESNGEVHSNYHEEYNQTDYDDEYYDEGLTSYDF